MNFTVKKEDLLPKLQYTASVVGSKNVMPVLGSLLFDVKNNILVITATNLAQAVQCAVEVDSDSDGKFTVPAKRILALLNTMPDNADITFDVEDGKVKVTCGASNFLLFTLPANDFPFEYPDVLKKTACTISQGDVQRIIALCKNAISKDDSRLLLTGLLLDYNEGGLTACSTDGKRMTIVESLSTSKEPCQAVIPAVVLPLLAKLSGEEIELYFDTQNIVVKAENMCIVSKLIFGKYPNYKSVVPQSFAYNFSFDTFELQSAVRQIAILADAEQSVELRFEQGKVTVSTEDSSVGSGAVSVLGECFADKDIVVRLNPKYLLDAISGCPERINIKLNNELMPIFVEHGENAYTILMPIRAR